MLSLVGAFVLAVGIGPLLWALMRSPREVEPVHLVPASAGLLLGIPPLVYLAITQRDLGGTIRSQPQLMWEGVGSIIVFIVVSSLAAFFLGRVYYSRSRVAGILSKLRAVGLNWILPIALVIWGFRIVAAVNYGWLYAGSYDPAGTPYVVFAARQVVEVLAAGVIAWSAWSIGENATQRRATAAIVLLILEGVYVFSQGRREMFFFVVLVGLIYLYSHGRVGWKQITVGLLGLSVLSFGAFPLYQSTRHALADRFGGTARSVGITEYYTIAAVASQRTDVKELYLTNLRDRLASYYRWQVEIASLRDLSGSLDGRLAVAGVQNAIPRFLAVDKRNVDWGESLFESYYGREFSDRPNSLVAAGFADFGLAGAAIYGVVFVLLVWVATSFGTWVAGYSPTLGAAVIGSVVLLALRTEISMVGVFSSLRNVALLGLFAVIWGVVRRSYRRRVFRSEVP